jgi:hypothetical protein
VKTLCSKALYVFFFNEIGTGRVHLAGVTISPNGDWIPQQVRQFVWLLQVDETSFHPLICDRDSKYTNLFDTIFNSESIYIICKAKRRQMPVPSLNDGCVR